MKKLSRDESFGCALSLLFAVACFIDLPGTFIREGGVNLVSLGIFSIGVGIVSFYIALPLGFFICKPGGFYFNPFKIMWLWSLGFLLYSVGMFLGSGIYRASLAWGFILLLCSLFFGYIAHSASKIFSR